MSLANALPQSVLATSRTSSPFRCYRGHILNEYRYEVGTSRLFEERMDEFIDDLDPLPEQPKQKPDRIIGLRETKNIHRLLEQPARFMRGDTAAKVRDEVRCSPLKDQSIPLLFPFLVLEAKSDSAHASSSDIQTQTAFPIRSLLYLQKELQSSRPGSKPVKSL